MNDNFNNGKIFCTKCGAPNKVGYRFCVRCGTKLVVPISRPEPEISQELPKTEPVSFEPEPAKTEPATHMFGVFEEPASQEEAESEPETEVFEPEPMEPEKEPVAFKPETIEPESAPQPFGVFEEPVAFESEPEETSQMFGVLKELVPQDELVAPESEPVAAGPEPEMPEIQPSFGAFEQPAPVAELVEAWPEPEMPEIQPSFGAFEQAAPVAESLQVEPDPIAFEPEPVNTEPQPTFSAFEQTAPQEEPVKTAGFAGNVQAAFEAEPQREFTGFARSGFSGATTPTATAGAFATAVDAVKNNKQIDVSDAETVMSLLEQGESSALAKGLPAWDIVPPQVVVRRKHRL